MRRLARFADIRQKGGRYPNSVRRGSAGRRDQSVPLRERLRAHSATDGQHQRAAGPVSHSDDADRVCEEVGPNALDGHEFRRRLQGIVRAGDRRQRHRNRVARRGMLGFNHTGHVDELITRYDLDDAARARWHRGLRGRRQAESWRVLCSPSTRIRSSGTI